MIATFSVTTYLLLGLALCGAIADWVCVFRRQAKLRWITKGLAPGFLILAVALHALEYPKASWATTIATFGLCCCLLGDYFLLDSKRFVPGLTAFGAAHLVFIAAFFTDTAWDPLENDKSLYSGRLIAVVVLLIAASVPGRKILSGAAKQKRVTAVILYLVTIAALVFMAGMHTTTPYGWTAFVGALLFLCSDLLLGWRLFVRRSPSPGLELTVMVTYHAALAGLSAWAMAA